MTEGYQESGRIMSIFNISTSTFLPPSTGSLRSVNVDRMERRFNDVASSIGDLVRCNMIRAVNVINDGIIAAIRTLNDLERTNADRRLVDAYTQQINDLQQ